jgi:hypothetical protein
MGDPRAVIDRLTAAQNAHDVEAMLTCFQEDYRSEQPQFRPGRSRASTRCAPTGPRC